MDSTLMVSHSSSQQGFNAMQLSDIPEIQQQQLKDLVATSEKKLAELTSPVSLKLGDELEEPMWTMYDSRVYVSDYVPPATRFGKINLRQSSLDFE